MRILAILFLVILMSGTFFGQSNTPRVRAPELSGGKGWLNTESPISLQSLRGKVVLLDFWTYGCINCIHIIPDLKRLEAKYPNELVVIGVHSAKFENEAETENIRRIVLRYEIEHPVVNDADYKIWSSYAVRAWPTRILIDPNGYIIDEIVGEGSYNEIDTMISETIAEFRKKGQFNETPLKFALESAKAVNMPLAFPGKVLADEKSGRLFITDSNHHRIVVTDLNGKLLETIGNGNSGLEDGDFENARFNRPQGLALDGDSLYVADTENHAVRRIDLKTKRVETVTGNGKQAEWRSRGGALKDARLSSPWDLTILGNDIFIAMAGTHQIWKIDRAKQTVSPYAGTGGEARFDAPIEEATFAQPSGLATNGEKLWVADSESNIIREIDLRTQNVETIVGGDLFEFGDKDGRGDSVRLQHPLAVVHRNGKIIIADTYNHKIKELDPVQRRVTTLFGTGKPGQEDGTKPRFYEPGGISIAGEKLYVADTNNHAIRVVDLKTGSVNTLKIDGLASPKPVSDEVVSAAPNLRETKAEAQSVKSGTSGSLSVEIKLPEGYHLNPNAPSRFELSISDKNAIKFEKLSGRFTTLPLKLPYKAGSMAQVTAKLKATLFYCREDNTGECLIRTVIWTIPVKIEENGMNGMQVFWSASQ